MGDVLPFPPDPALRQVRARFEAEARRLSERLDQLEGPQIFAEIANGQFGPRPVVWRGRKGSPADMRRQGHDLGGFTVDPPDDEGAA